jgi:bis(5'-nucleosyl)-tetraphosphatase (symmetrical)
MTLYAIGDIQGCLDPFDRLLETIDFTAGRDRLWLVGDLVNRGPDSLGVLRRVIALDDSVDCVLGNHDLHLLATAAGVRQPGRGDTLDAVLHARDRDALLDWLRMRPMLVTDANARRVLVHAGLPMNWTVKDAQTRAAEVEARLRAPDWARALTSMYGNEPRRWSGTLTPDERRRYTINALTRMRFCAADGALDFTETGPPGSQPATLVPWFELPRRRAADWHIVFGHWAALGLLRRDNLTALDSGCVWGGSLTAVPLDSPGEATSVACFVR